MSVFIMPSSGPRIPRKPAGRYHHGDLRNALLKALPWLDGKEIKQQVSFTIRLGHAVIHVDGKERKKKGRGVCRDL